MKHVAMFFSAFLFFQAISFSQARPGPTQTTLGYWNLNESSGSVAADLSGNGNNGTTGATTIAVGKVGNCRQLPSSTAAGILVPNSSSLNIIGSGSAASLTLEAFLKISGSEQAGVNIVSRQGQYALTVGSFSSAGYLQLQLWVGPTPPVVVQSDIQVLPGQWVHVAGTWDGTTVKLYMDHILVKTVAVSGTLNSVATQVLIANFGTAVAPTTQAWVDEVRISRGALQSVELTQVDTGAGPVGWWPMNELSGSTVFDVSANGNHGSTGATTIAVGKVGNCRQLPSSTAAGILVPNSSSLNIIGSGSAASLTLEAFLKSSGSEQAGVNIVSRQGQYALTVGSFSSAGYLQLQLWVGPTPPIVVQADSPVPINQWVHVAGTWDGTTAKLYIGYVLVKTVAVSGTLISVTAPVMLPGSQDSFV